MRSLQLLGIIHLNVKAIWPVVAEISCYGDQDESHKLFHNELLLFDLKITLIPFEKQKQVHTLAQVQHLIFHPVVRWL